MPIFDCFLYSNEDLILDIRLNTLDPYVEKFVIVEAAMDHQGNKKKIVSCTCNTFLCWLGNKDNFIYHPTNKEIYGIPKSRAQRVIWDTPYCGTEFMKKF